MSEETLHHFGDPCVHCGIGHDDVPIGPCKGDPAKAVPIAYRIASTSGRNEPCLATALKAQNTMNEDWPPTNCRHPLCQQCEEHYIALVDKLSTTEQSLAAFKSRAERAEAVVETLLEWKRQRPHADSQAVDAYLIDVHLPLCRALLHQPTETGTPK